MTKIYKPVKLLISVCAAQFLSISVNAQTPVITEPVVEQIATGFQFVEGPLWVDSLGLLFSDIPANKVYRWNPLTNSTTIYLDPSGNSNGIKRDTNGDLLLAQHGKRRVARIRNGVETPVVSLYKGKQLNSPNDIAVSSSGSIFFTDPPYGISPQQQVQPFSGVYRVTPNGKIKAIDSVMARPNGIVFSPDETKLYVNNSEERKIYSWDVVNDSTFTNKQEFAFLSGNGNADGMTVDANGFVYSTGPGGVWVIAPDKTIMQTIQVPGQNTNCTFGGPGMATLYVTSGNSVYRVRNRIVAGLNDSFENKSNSVQIFPNPVSTSSTISYNSEHGGHATIQVSNALGNVISTLFDGEVAAGNNNFVLNGDKINHGVYFLSIHTGKSTLVKSFVVR